MANISCPSDLASTIKSFVFGGDPSTPTMEIVQGAKTLFALSLADFFITLDKYVYQEFTVAKGETKDIDGGNIASTLGEVQFLAILVEYPATNDADAEVESTDHYIKYEYPVGAGQLNIGKIMILSGSTLAQAGWDFDSSPGALRLYNPHDDFDVEVKVLAFN